MLTGRAKSIGLTTALAVAVMFAVLMALSADATSRPAPKKKTVGLQVLSTNDFHGRLNPQTVSGQPAGGAAWLAGYLGRAEGTNPDGTLLLDGGDMVGATPLESQYFEDRPTVDVANATGYDDVTFGNHEFDAGTERLSRQVEWANYPYWSANVIDRATGKPYLHPAPYEVFKRRGVSVGVINLTTEATPSIVNPSGIEGLSFASTVQTANSAVAQLKARGVRTIVIAGHLGTDGCLPTPAPGCDGDALVTDPNDIAKNEAAKLARNVDDEVDLIVAGHTHQGVNTTVDGKRIVEAYSYGTAYSDVLLRVSRTTGNVVSSRANVVRTFHNKPDGTPAVTPDATVQRIVDRANEAVAPIRNEVVGQTTVDLKAPRTATSPAGESNLGDVVADAMNRKADVLEGQVDFAFENAGGIRADIPSGDITRGEVIEVLPFQNVLVTTTLTGAQVDGVLEQGASGQFGMVQISGLSFSYDPSQPVGSRVDPSSVIVEATGQPLDPSAAYRVVTNDFMFNGGDNYTAFKEGTNPVIYSEGLLSDVLVEYVKGASPITQQIEGRITTTP